MYLRTVRAKGAEGVELEYIRLVEAYWENGRSKQRIVANLGRKDLLAPHLESLIELLGGGKKTKASSAERIEATLAACWGPMLVARWLWRELGLENILDGLAPKTNRVQKAGRLPLADRVLVLVANRLCRPGSEHALAQWLESDFVCGRDGKRILASWKQQGRVRVDLNWLQEWYRTLDQLLARKDRIEVELFGRLRDLFHLQVEMVFYDLTSKSGVRVFVVQSEERLSYERAMREAAMEKTRQALEKLSVRVAAGRLKKAQKIGEAAARILGRNHGSRYYAWSFEQGLFRYFEHPGNLAPEKALEGKYVIQTEEVDLSAVQAVEGYKDLSEVERSFRELKDLIEMRPIYHHRPKRVRAHIFVAALAFLLARALEKKLKAAGVPMSSAQALEALRTMHVVDIRVGKEIRRGVTAGNHQARQILAALGISDREPLQAQSLEKNAHLVTN
jgi:hypothetical protein